MKAPNSRRNLDIAIQRKYGLGDEYMRARTVMANAIVGQMLPDGGHRLFCVRGLWSEGRDVSEITRVTGHEHNTVREYLQLALKLARKPLTVAV